MAQEQLADQTQYSAENIRVLEGLEAIRLRPAMYIGSTISVSATSWESLTLRWWNLTCRAMIAPGNCVSPVQRAMTTDTWSCR